MEPTPAPDAYTLSQRREDYLDDLRRLRWFLAQLDAHLQAGQPSPVVFLSVRTGSGEHNISLRNLQLEGLAHLQAAADGHVATVQAAIEETAQTLLKTLTPETPPCSS